jgi:sugar phosphate isomerase/epimerase
MALEEALTALAELGYDGVELCLEIHDLRPDVVAPGRLAEIGDALAASELALASVSYHADGEDLATRVPNTVRAVEMTGELGADILIVNAERSDEARRDAQWAALVERLARVCAAAEAAGVDIAVEPEPLLLVHGMEDWARLRAEVGSPRLKINLDIGHCAITDPDVPGVIERFAEDIVHVHFEDIPAGVHQHLVPGEGDLDLAAIAEALRRVGYDGFVTIDLFHIHGDPRGFAERCVAPTRALLEPPCRG